MSVTPVPSVPLHAPLLEGRPAPLGASLRDGGLNIAVFSQHATAVELCVFDARGQRELARHALHGPSDGVWHGFLPGVGVGLVYGLRAHGPYAPDEGQRFNPHKLLLDPYAQEIIGRFAWDSRHYGHNTAHPDGIRQMDTRDNADIALKARVPAPLPPPAVPPALHRRPRVAVRDMVLYELHLKGFTMALPGLPDALRGTYAGLAHPAAIAHFQRLGVTTLSLLPVQHHLDEVGLAARGTVNYWGYNTIGFFAPDPRYAQQPDDPAAVNTEFRAMVAALHEAGLELVLDVVYNHTAEAGEDGPTLSMRGLDHASWYRLLPDDASRCDNVTGCGNTVNVAHPRITQFVLDSLRHWVQAMGVDGFRFDLAPVLGRLDHGFDPQAGFFTAVLQDPVLSQVHLIAEPWDAGLGGYQVGRFPGGWLEWNDRFRDSVRRYWLGQGTGRGEFARRFSASNDLFHHGQRRPTASINFIAVHDGFTLSDVVSYAGKHNLANGEDNRDGRSDEPCHPFGPEGAAATPAQRALRRRVQRALLATLLLAQGTPMLGAGDEFGNSQRGNNNAYNQDNPLGWLDWADADQDLIDFVAQLTALRRAQPTLRHERWFATQAGGPGERQLDWLAPSGQPMALDDWHDGQQHALACHVHGHHGQPGASGASAEPALYIGFNPAPQPQALVLPLAGQAAWTLHLDSSGECPPGQVLPPGATLQAPAHSLVVLVQGPPAR